jgi:lactoylglutathione lyase
MKLLWKKDLSDFSLYFMGSSVVDDNADHKALFNPVLELTHNHGTENDADFRYYNGNEEGRQGFGHIGFLGESVTQSLSISTRSNFPQIAHKLVYIWGKSR